MFNMQDMLADMLKKSIPPEVMEKLTAENLKDIGDKATAFVSDIRGALDRIEANQKTLIMQSETNYERQSRILEGIAELKEARNDDGSSNDGNKPRQRRNVRASASGLASDSGDGSVAG